jgi:hypothetical protein
LARLAAATKKAMANKEKVAAVKKEAAKEAVEWQKRKWPKKL